MLSLAELNDANPSPCQPKIKLRRALNKIHEIEIKAQPQSKDLTKP